MLTLMLAPFAFLMLMGSTASLSLSISLPPSRTLSRNGPRNPLILSPQPPQHILYFTCVAVMRARKGSQNTGAWQHSGSATSWRGLIVQLAIARN